MYKHHSYNNVVERKLQQLPAADTDGLWSSMEAILDQQLPPKKRRPGLLGWLSAQKAWMVAALVVGTAAGASLVYFSGDNPPAARQEALPGTHAPQGTASTSAIPGPSAPAPVVAANGEVPATPATTGPDASLITSLHQKQLTENPTAVPTEVSASVQTTEPSFKPANPEAIHGTLNATPEALTSRPVAASDLNGAAATTDDGNDQAIRWAAATRALPQEAVAAPAVNPAGVRTETGTLEYLSQQVAAASAAARKGGRLPQEKGPYVGVVAGLDLSSVAFGSMQTGNNKGFLAGYAFNNRWSVESGLLWNRKNYSADGSRYKADGFAPQPGLTILEVNSVTQLYELPLNVKYNIVARRHKLFATAGVSSYIMKKELIDLNYTYNGQRGNQYDVYSNASKHWLSVAGFSLGYTHRLGSFGSLRVEPYVRLPLRDLGVGNMRVTSTGLNVGFTKMLRQ